MDSVSSGIKEFFFLSAWAAEALLSVEIEWTELDRLVRPQPNNIFNCADYTAPIEIKK
jgi:hypothetical protein